MTPHDPTHEQWLTRLEVGAGIGVGSIGIDPIMKTKRKQHHTIPPASIGSQGWMWVLGIGVGPVLGIEGAVLCLLLAEEGCNMAGGTYLNGCTHSSSFPVIAGPLSTLYPLHEQRGLMAAVGGSSSLV